MKKSLSLLAYNGKKDHLVTENLAEKSYKRLVELGFSKIEYVSQAGLGHSVSETELKKVR